MFLKLIIILLLFWFIKNQIKSLISKKIKNNQTTEFNKYKHSSKFEVKDGEYEEIDTD